MRESLRSEAKRSQDIKVGQSYCFTDDMWQYTGVIEKGTQIKVIARANDFLRNVMVVTAQFESGERKGQTISIPESMGLLENVVTVN